MTAELQDPAAAPAKASPVPSPVVARLRGLGLPLLQRTLVVALVPGCCRAT